MKVVLSVAALAFILLLAVLLTGRESPVPVNSSSEPAASPSQEPVSPEPQAEPRQPRNPPRPPWWIKAEGHSTSSTTVEVEIDSNLPDGAVLAVDLSLQGQDDDDVFIGTSFKKVSIRDGAAHLTLDGSKSVYPRNSNLPSGTYDLAATFHPRWDENKRIASSIGVKEEISGVGSVRLLGSGESSSDASLRAERRKWVMLNVHSGMKWNPSEWQTRFGHWQEQKLEGGGNPNILKLYYFPALDMTLIVNALKGEIITWRDGRETRALGA